MKKLLWLLVCSVSFGLTADYNDDCIVNFEDYAYLAGEYRSLAASCVAQWTMNDNTGSNIVIDSVGDYNGTATQNTEDMHVEGKTDGALYFNGTSDYVALTTNFESEMENSFSISVWFYVEDCPVGDYRTIISSFGTDNSWVALMMVPVVPPSVAFYAQYFSSYSGAVLVSPEFSIWGQWVHAVMVIEKLSESTGKAYLYINGEIYSQSAVTTVHISNFNGPDFYIGAENFHDIEAAEFFKGSIDNLILFDKALSQSEVEWLYYNGSGTEFGLNASVNYDLDSDDDVDLDDLAEFALQWLHYVDEGVVADVNLVIPRNTTMYLQLAVDIGDTYRILSLPAYGTLYDPNSSDPNYTDPNSENPAVVEIDSVPYTLLNTDSTVLYVADVNYYGITTFTYDSDTDPNNENCGNSNVGTATIYCTIVPIAYDSEESVQTYIVYSFELSAIDDGTPQPLIYEVNNIASNSIMADPFVGTPVLDANLIPWTLRYNGDDILFIIDTVGDSNFMFRAYDGNSYSNYATVQITATANPMDALYLNSEPNAIITIPDNDYLDIMGPQWACSFWFNNYLRRPYQTLMSKRSAGPGYEISLKAGKVQFDLYDVNGLVTSVRSDTIISDGQWYCTDIIYAYDDDPNYGYILIQTFNSSALGIGYQSGSAFAHSAFSNDANVVIAESFGFDHLRYWNDVNNAADSFICHFAGRQNYEEEWSGLGNASNVRYKCDEGSGGTITDDKGNADDGVFDPNYVIWHPPYEIFRSLVKH